MMSCSCSTAEGSSLLSTSLPYSAQSSSSSLRPSCSRHDVWGPRGGALSALEPAAEERAWLGLDWGGEGPSLEDLLLRLHDGLEGPMEAAAAALASAPGDEDLAQAGEALSEELHELTAAGLRAAAALCAARAKALPSALGSLKGRSGPLTRVQALRDLDSVQALLCSLGDACSDALEWHARLQDRTAYLVACAEVVIDTRRIGGDRGERLSCLERATAHYRKAEALLQEGGLVWEALYSSWAEVQKTSDLLDEMRKLCKTTVDGARAAFPFYECLGTTLHTCLTSLKATAA